MVWCLFFFFPFDPVFQNTWLPDLLNPNDKEGTLPSIYSRPCCSQRGFAFWEIDKCGHGECYPCMWWGCCCLCVLCCRQKIGVMCESHTALWIPAACHCRECFTLWFITEKVQKWPSSPSSSDLGSDFSVLFFNAHCEGRCFAFCLCWVYVQLFLLPKSDFPNLTQSH